MTSNSLQIIDSVSLLGGRGASVSEAVLGSSPDLLGVALTASSRSISSLGLDGPVVSAHLATSSS